MSTTVHTAAPGGLGFPAIGPATLMTILIAGSVATIAFDLFGQAISPMLGFPNLAPVPLATQTWGVLFGEAYAPGGNLLHYVAGLLAYPIGWMFIWRPLAERFAPNLPWLVSAVLYGIALWVFALYIMAHLIAGNPAFLGFTQLTWVAFVGHILFAVVVAWVERWRAGAA